MFLQPPSTVFHRLSLPQSSGARAWLQRCFPLAPFTAHLPFLRPSLHHVHPTTLPLCSPHNARFTLKGSILRRVLSKGGTQGQGRATGLSAKLRSQRSEAEQDLTAQAAGRMNPAWSTALCICRHHGRQPRHSSGAGAAAGCCHGCHELQPASARCWSGVGGCERSLRRRGGKLQLVQQKRGRCQLPRGWHVARSRRATSSRADGSQPSPDGGQGPEGKG